MNTRLELKQDNAEPLPTMWVDRLFLRLHNIFGPTVWSQQSLVKKQSWANVLAGYQASEIAQGLANLRRDPNKNSGIHPEEFANYCRPWLDPRVARDETMIGYDQWLKGNSWDWSHPALFWAAYELRDSRLFGEYEDIEEEWTKHLKAQLDKGEWEPVLPPLRRKRK